MPKQTKHDAMVARKIGSFSMVVIVVIVDARVPSHLQS